MSLLITSDALTPILLASSPTLIASATLIRRLDRLRRGDRRLFHLDRCGLLFFTPLGGPFLASFDLDPLVLPVDQFLDQGLLARRRDFPHQDLDGGFSAFLLRFLRFRPAGLIHTGRRRHCDILDDFQVRSPGEFFSRDRRRRSRRFRRRLWFYSRFRRRGLDFPVFRGSDGEGFLLCRRRLLNGFRNRFRLFCSATGLPAGRLHPSRTAPEPVLWRHRLRQGLHGRRTGLAIASPAGVSR